MEREKLNVENEVGRREAIKSWLVGLVAAAIGGLALLLPARKARAGWGACQIYGCYCKTFEGNTWHCEYCGHRFQDHW